MVRVRKKIGIFGGSFNPVHLGHLLVAQDIFEKLKLDKMLFIPAFAPPHKRHLLSYQHRFKMLKLAIAGNPFFELSDIEAKRGGKSFTVDTLRELKKIYPNDQLYLIIGADQFRELSNWKEPKKLCQLAKIVVMPRPNCPIPATKNRLANTMTLKVIQIEIASKLIRKRISQGLSVRYMLPEKVWHYIIKNRLYQNSAFRYPFTT
ncbi:MAG: nicotinate-nucleotide adenylyltransferase [candidate division WOR-3 bacterium]